MQRMNSLWLFLLGLLLLGLSQLAGCATGGDRPPPMFTLPPPPVQAADAFKLAEEAFENDSYERALELYSAVLSNPEGVSEEQVQVARARLGAIDSIFRQRTVAARRERLEGLLTEANGLVSEGRYEEAEATLAGLGVGQDLTDEQRDALRRLRVDVVRATGGLAGMTPDEAKQLASECLGRAMRAFHAKDYAAADDLFDQAAAMEQHLGLWSQGALRSRWAEVTEKLAELRGDYREAERLHARQQYARAVGLLQKVVDSGISIGAEQDQEVVRLLGESALALAEQRQREGEKREAWEREREEDAKQLRLKRLLAEAKVLVSQKSYEEAAPKLTLLVEARQDLGEEQWAEVQRMRAVVERATGKLPGMSAEEAEVLAADYLQRALAAHGANDYVKAEALFERAAALEEHLDEEGRRTLLTRRAVVTEKLAGLRGAHAEGKRLFALQDFAKAAESLQTVVDSGISIGPEQDREVAMLLRGCEDRLADQLKREEAERLAAQRRIERQEEIQALAVLLGEARTLVAEERHGEADPKLVALMQARQDLTAQQWREVQLLRTAVERATGRLPGMTDEEGRELAVNYMAGAMNAYDIKDYVAAEGLLERAIALEEFLGLEARRILRATQTTVVEKLVELRAAYTDGKQLYGQQDYAGAFVLLQKVADSGISFGAEQDLEVAAMLRDCKINLPMALSSPAFAQGEPIPDQYTDDGQNISPPLVWEYPPQGTVTFALIVDDPDAPTFTFTHWLISEIRADTRALPEGVASRGAAVDGPAGATQGINGFRKLGYGGPAPPEGKTHRYYFRLYALDEGLDLPPRFSRNQLQAAMQGHILAEAELMGTYGR